MILPRVTSPCLGMELIIRNDMERKVGEVFEYNSEKYIVECLESIFSQQTKYTFLVSVVNDGSTDQTETVLKAYAEKFDSIHGAMEIITQENKGLSEARNAALRRIRGRYVMFIDADDVLACGAIDALLRNHCDMVQGGYYEFAEGYREVINKLKEEL